MRREGGVYICRFQKNRFCQNDVPLGLFPYVDCQGGRALSHRTSKFVNNAVCTHVYVIAKLSKPDMADRLLVYISL